MQSANKIWSQLAQSFYRLIWSHFARNQTILDSLRQHFELYMTCRLNSFLHSPVMMSLNFHEMCCKIIWWLKNPLFVHLPRLSSGRTTIIFNNEMISLLDQNGCRVPFTALRYILAQHERPLAASNCKLVSKYDSHECLGARRKMQKKKIELIASNTRRNCEQPSISTKRKMVKGI